MADEPTPYVIELYGKTVVTPEYLSAIGFVPAATLATERRQREEAEKSCWDALGLEPEARLTPLELPEAIAGVVSRSKSPEWAKRIISELCCKVLADVDDPRELLQHAIDGLRAWKLSCDGHKKRAESAESRATKAEARATEGARLLLRKVESQQAAESELAALRPVVEAAKQYWRAWDGPGSCTKERIAFRRVLDALPSPPAVKEPDSDWVLRHALALTGETPEQVCERLGIDVPKWAAEIRAKVAAATHPHGSDGEPEEKGPVEPIGRMVPRYDPVPVAIAEATNSADDCTCTGPARDAHDKNCPVRKRFPRIDLGDAPVESAVTAHEEAAEWASRFRQAWKACVDKAVREWFPHTSGKEARFREVMGEYEPAKEETKP